MPFICSFEQRDWVEGLISKNENRRKMSNLRKLQLANLKKVIVLTVVLFFISLFSQQTLAQNQNVDSKNIKNKIVQFLEKQGSYTKVSDGVWIVSYKGKSIKNIELLVITAAEIELVIMTVTVAKKKEIPLKPDLLYKILKFSADQVKVGISDKGDLNLQAEINARLTDYKEFNEVLNQVAAAADLLHGQIKSSLILEQ
jgi:hypothetical protein